MWVTDTPLEIEEEWDGGKGEEELGVIEEASGHGESDPVEPLNRIVAKGLELTEKKDPLSTSSPRTRTVVLVEYWQVLFHLVQGVRDEVEYEGEEN
jgi:hypothetical protein